MSRGDESGHMGRKGANGLEGSIWPHGASAGPCEFTELYEDCRNLLGQRGSWQPLLTHV